MDWNKYKIKYDEPFEVDEMCPHCGYETNGIFNPSRDKGIICQHCGELILPCSLCDCSMVPCDCGADKELCVKKIDYVLRYYNAY